ncbi:MAG TPA: tyrosine--tRNA ligase [Elusimicrobia bacterium]|nr:MAG: tyrosine--tRNA ligase [Elusimicrobia bacterium GWA2_66_18]OGR68567.1 MAG: tyrosine--tRNA ligase [Elusimicrobia bacterium GWC2_65_9]HAZ08441.1 tyrosine--tRNA ligase [Elusimicrobiota bacterium]
MDLHAQLASLKRGCVSLVSEAELAKKLASGRTLRVKLGVDPTSADLHLGHSVVLTRLRRFQDLGHTAVLIIGDLTARVGDPSGRDSTRPALTAADVQANAKTYQEQAFKILDPQRTELRFNSEWLEPFMRDLLLDTLKRHTVQQLLAREDFKKRIAENSPLTLLEVLYPLLQGYDSVAVKADVELGGNDQLTNLLMGRKMQVDAGQDAQVAMTEPLLVGLDGEKKMSKSYGNAISLNDAPNEMFGKVMKASDELMLSYYELLTDADLEAVKAQHPMKAKKALARTLVARFHGEPAAAEALAYFENTFSKKELPTDLRVVSVPMGSTLSEIIGRAGGAKSRGEARRLVLQGGVRIDGVKVAADGAVRSPAAFVLQMGKHQFVRIELRAP